MAHDRGLGLCRRLLRVDANVENGPRVRLHGGGRALDGGTVDPEHRDARPAPDLRADPARPDDRHALLELG